MFSLDSQFAILRISVSRQVRKASLAKHLTLFPQGNSRDTQTQMKGAYDSVQSE